MSNPESGQSDQSSRRPASGSPLRVVLWMAFAGLLLLSGYRLLWACTVSAHAWPTFLASLLPDDCRAGPDDLSREKEKVAALTAAVQQAEHAVLVKAATCTADCPPPAPAPPPPAPPPPPPEPQKKAGDILDIPSNANDLDFLKGCWQSTSKIVRSHDDAEIVAKYCFQQGGRGTIQITGPAFECRGDVTGSVPGSGKLRIDVPKVRCSDGQVFNRNVVQCRSGDTGALCDIDNFDDNGRQVPNVKVRDGQFKRVE